MIVWGGFDVSYANTGREILRGNGSYSNTGTHGNSDSDSNTKCYSDGHPYCDADRNTCNAAHSDPAASSHTGASADPVADSTRRRIRRPGVAKL